MIAILSPLVILFAVWLILERFVFDDKLAGLFVEGWRDKLGLKTRKRKGPNKPPPAASSERVLDPDALIEKKRYVVGHNMTRMDSDPETGKPDGNNDSFAQQDTRNDEPDADRNNAGPGGMDNTGEDERYTYRMVVVSGGEEDGDDDCEIRRAPAVRPESSAGEPATEEHKAESGLSEFDPTEEERTAIESFDPADYL